MLLGFIGGKPIEQPYLIVGQLATFIYFSFFIFIIWGDFLDIKVLNILYANEHDDLYPYPEYESNFSDMSFMDVIKKIPDPDGIEDVFDFDDQENSFFIISDIENQKYICDIYKGNDTPYSEEKMRREQEIDNFYSLIIQNLPHSDTKFCPNSKFDD